MEKRENYPEHIESKIQMTEPNEEIQICKGILVLKNKNGEIKIKGDIIYKWFPKIGAEFHGLLTSELKTLFNPFELNDYDLYFKDLKLGKVFITEKRYFSTNPNETIVTGVFKENLFLGDKTINVNQVYFSIPNFKSLFGNLTTFNNGNGGTRSRLSLENDKYNIEIDKSLDYDNKLRQLKNKGGFTILYGGLIKSKKGTLSITEKKSIFSCLDLFLTFLMGRRSSTIFHSGYCEKEKIWIDYSNKNNLTYKNAESWTLRNSINGIDGLFKEFSTLWKNENDRDFLKTLIHWYVEANNNSGFVEGSIIMAQTALELIYNWLLIEKGKLIKGSDAINISASNKIRLLLSHVKIKNEIPNSLTELNKLINSKKEDLDAPEVIVQIRNAIIHSQLEKRKKLLEITFEAKSQALKLYIWYIELSILYILNYKGKYTNRCSDEQFPGDRETDVPWI
ncbi:MAG: hypothetical protein NWQ31_00890 [Polaribacter sp.]|nr:hypothetical protein [Polaribacter sp.]